MRRIAINGLGRIGRSAFKIILEESSLELAAVNDLVPAENLAYMLNYDTVYRRYNKKVQYEDSTLIVDGKKIKVFNEKDPSKLPWKDLDIDIVIESTGRFTKKEDLEKHAKAGARYIILSAPTNSDEIITVVHGVNKSDENAQIISCASCTTNCITPVVEIISRRIGIKKAIMTAVHAYTSSQAIVDGPNKKMRRGRAAAANFVPASTGAAIATTKALPELKGKFDGVAIRGPVPVGSIADIVILTERTTTVEEINSILEEEAESERYKGILGVTHDPIVSSDIIMDPHASIVDLELTQVVDGDLIKIMSWYDNEWGYTNQLVREAVRISHSNVPVNGGQL
jgi:glyceraldehyde 3-phosphate dehydrogenase